MRMLLAATVALTAPLAAIAADEVNPNVAARQGYFSLLGANMGPLAAMAKGEMDYDEATAATAAANIEALSTYMAGVHFAEGTSVDDLGKDVTEASADIWTDMDGFKAKFEDFAAAAAGAGEAVKGGQGNVGPVLQKIGGTCKGCHDDYRVE